MIKVPSAVNNNTKLLEWIYKNYNGEIHISLGMTTKKEEDNIIKIARETKRLIKPYYIIAYQVTLLRLESYIY